MAMSKTVNTKPEPEADLFNWELPTEWKEALTGFPPYWTAEEGAKWMGKVIGKDDNGQFVRYLVQATKPMRAYRGGAEDQTDCVVMPGEYFTLSMYNNLQLERYIGAGEIGVMCTGQIKANTPSGFVWGFKLLMSPQTERLLAERDAQNPLLNTAEAEDRERISA